MADSQPLSGAPEGAEYLRAVLRAPVYEAAQVTPLQKMEKLSSRLDNVILVKREDRQPVHSFKLRGAYAMMAGLTEEQKAHGVITASAGNHAQGVAFSSARLGVKALIVMPTATADIKVDAVRGFGGEVLLHGANFDEAKAKAIELSQQQGFTWVPPFDHPMVIAGQGTLALELLQQDAHLDRVFVPVGGGGLAAGVAVLIKQLMPQIKVIAVEAEDSACLKAALDAGHPVDLPRVGLFAEGVAVKRIGDETFRLCQEYLDDIITVDSDAICAAMKDLFEDVRAVAEPSGALALAGMKKYIALHNIRGERLAHILSGANVNFHGLRYVSERCEVLDGLLSRLRRTSPERVAEIRKYCEGAAEKEISRSSRKSATIKLSAYINSNTRGVMSHIQRETSCSRPRLNSNMDADLYGYKWARDNVGQSGATIYRLYGKPDAPELFLKHGKGSVANDVTDEMVRLNWLTEFMPLPTIKHFIRTPDDAWLLTTAIPGKTAFQVLEEYPDSGENIVDALAVFLHRLHSIPVCNCPFNSDRVFRLAQAQSRMNNGLVDASDFDDERNGWPVEQVWKEMHKLLPFSPDSVVTHGDFSLDNLIFDEGKLIGCIDVGRVGIADRYQDLAILWNCLGEFSPSLQKRLFQKYGIDNPDMNKLQFHLMLDEFF